MRDNHQTTIQFFHQFISYFGWNCLEGPIFSDLENVFPIQLTLVVFLQFIYFKYQSFKYESVSSFNHHTTISPLFVFWWVCWVLYCEQNWGLELCQFNWKYLWDSDWSSRSPRYWCVDVDQPILFATLPFLSLQYQTQTINSSLKNQKTNKTKKRMIEQQESPHLLWWEEDGYDVVVIETLCWVENALNMWFLCLLLFSTQLFAFLIQFLSNFSMCFFFFNLLILRYSRINNW